MDAFLLCPSVLNARAAGVSDLPQRWSRQHGPWTRWPTERKWAIAQKFLDLDRSILELRLQYGKLGLPKATVYGWVSQRAAG